MQIGCLLVVIVLSLTVINAQIQYGLVQLQGSQCVELEQNKCTPCGGYYYIADYDYGRGDVSVYADPQCEYYVTPYRNVERGYCHTSQQNCTVLLQPKIYSYSTASFSTSTSSLKLGTSAPREQFYLSAQISPTSVEALGYLDFVEVITESSRFVFEGIISATQYVCTFGVFEFGETYTKEDITFTINHFTNETSIPYSIPDFGVKFSPFSNIRVTSSATYNIDFLFDGTILVATDSTYNLEGIEIGDVVFPNYLETMTLYPPAYDDSEANLLFKVSSHANTFWTFPCEPSEQFINCEFSSGIFIFLAGSSFLPSLNISLDQQIVNNNNNVDDMSFSLF